MNLIARDNNARKREYATSDANWNADMVKMHDDIAKSPNFIDDEGDLTTNRDNTFDKEHTSFLKENPDIAGDESIDSILGDGLSSPESKEVRAKAVVDDHFNKPFPKEAFMGKLKQMGHDVKENDLKSEGGIPQTEESERPVDYPQPDSLQSSLHNASMTKNVVDSILHGMVPYSDKAIKNAEQDTSRAGIIKLTGMKLARDFSSLVGKDVFSKEIEDNEEGRTVARVSSDILTYVLVSTAVGIAIEFAVVGLGIGTALQSTRLFQALSKAKKFKEGAKIGKEGSNIATRLGKYLGTKAKGIVAGAPQTLGAMYITTDLRKAILEDDSIMGSYEHILSTEYGVASMKRMKSAFGETLYSIPIELLMDVGLNSLRGAGGILRSIIKGKSDKASKATMEVAKNLKNASEIVPKISETTLKEKATESIANIISTSVEDAFASDLAKVKATKILGNLANPKDYITEDSFKALMKKSKLSTNGYVPSNFIKGSVIAHSRREIFNDYVHNARAYEILKTHFGDIFSIKDGAYRVESANKYLNKVRSMPRSSKESLVTELSENMLQYVQNSGATSSASGLSANTATGTIKEQIYALGYVKMVEDAMAEAKIKNFIPQIAGFSKNQLDDVLHIYALNTLSSKASNAKNLAKSVMVLPKELRDLRNSIANSKSKFKAVPPPPIKEAVKDAEVKATKEVKPRTRKPVVKPEVPEPDIDLFTADNVVNGLSTLVVNGIVAKLNYPLILVGTTTATGLNMFASVVGKAGALASKDRGALDLAGYLKSYSDTYLGGIYTAVARPDTALLFKWLKQKVVTNETSRGVAKITDRGINFANNMLMSPANLTTSLKDIQMKAASLSETMALHADVLRSNMSNEVKNLVTSLMHKDNNWRSMLGSLRNYADVDFLKRIGWPKDTAELMSQEIGSVISTLEGFGSVLKTLNKSGSTYITNLERSGSAFIKVSTMTAMPQFSLGAMLTMTPWTSYAHTSGVFPSLNTLNRGRAVVGMAMYNAGIKAYINHDIKASITRGVVSETGGKTDEAKERELLGTLGSKSNIVLMVRDGATIPMANLNPVGLAMALPALIGEATRLSGGQFTESEMEHVLLVSNNIFKAMKTYITDMTKMNSIFEKGMGRSVYKVLQTFTDPVSMATPSITIAKSLARYIGEEEAKRTELSLDTIMRGGNEVVTIHSAVTGKPVKGNSLFFDMTPERKGLEADLLRTFNWLPKNLKTTFGDDRFTDAEMSFIADKYDSEKFEEYAREMISFYKTGDITEDEATIKLEKMRNTLETEAVNKLFIKNARV